MDISQLYIPKIVTKLLNIDLLYVLVSITLIVLIYHGHNILDIFYFLIITYYYIRVKVHRKKLKK